MACSWLCTVVRQTCPEKHKLEAENQQTKSNKNTCDMCEQSVPMLWGCRTCNFDLCKACVRKKTLTEEDEAHINLWRDRQSVVRLCLQYGETEAVRQNCPGRLPVNDPFRHVYEPSVVDGFAFCDVCRHTAWECHILWKCNVCKLELCKDCFAKTEFTPEELLYVDCSKKLASKPGWVKGPEDGWQFDWDHTRERWFFMNRFTGKSSWETPADCPLTLPSKPPSDVDPATAEMLKKEQRGLPRGWWAAWCRDTHRLYYCSHFSQERRWTRPTKPIYTANGVLAERDLPPGWREAIDRTSGQVYYYNRGTKESVWQRPTAQSPQNNDQNGSSPGRGTGSASGSPSPLEIPEPTKIGAGKPPATETAAAAAANAAATEIAATETAAVAAANAAATETAAVAAANVAATEVAATEVAATAASSSSGAEAPGANLPSPTNEAAAAATTTTTATAPTTAPTTTPAATAAIAATIPATTTATTATTTTTTTTTTRTTKTTTTTTTTTTVAPPAAAPPPGVSPEGFPTCTLCFDNQVDTLFIPCGHLASCFTCAEKLNSSTRICPFCRQNVTAINRVFIP